MIERRWQKDSNRCFEWHYSRLFLSKYRNKFNQFCQLTAVKGKVSEMFQANAPIVRCVNLLFESINVALCCVVQWTLNFIFIFRVFSLLVTTRYDTNQPNEKKTWIEQDAFRLWCEEMIVILRVSPCTTTKLFV